MERKYGEKCVLYERDCIGCLECETCDLDPSKVCDNCGKCIGLDAHSTEMVKGYYDASISYAKKAGIDTLYVFNDGKWSEAESL